jgi:hypothetical protein
MIPKTIERARTGSALATVLAKIILFFLLEGMIHKTKADARADDEVPGNRLFLFEKLPDLWRWR